MENIFFGNTHENRLNLKCCVNYSEAKDDVKFRITCDKKKEYIFNVANPDCILAFLGKQEIHAIHKVLL